MTGLAFRLWNIPVRVEPSFALVVLFGLGLGSLVLVVAWVAVVFATTLVHELGHAFAFRRYGRPSSITLWAFGGLTQPEGQALKGSKDIAVSLAGPLAGMLVLGVPALLIQSMVHPTSEPTGTILRMLVLVAIAWSAVNLLPVRPLDGGHISTSILEGIWGIAGVRAAIWLSIAVALAGGGYAFTKGYTFAAIYGAFFAVQNFSELAQLREIPRQERLAEGHRLLDAGDTQAASRVAQDVLADARSGPVRADAVELSAWALLAGGQRADAARALEQLSEGVRPSRALLACFFSIDGLHSEAVEAASSALLDEAIPNLTFARTVEQGGLIDDIVERLVSRGDDAGLRAAGDLASQLHAAERFGASVAVTERLARPRTSEPDADL